MTSTACGLRTRWGRRTRRTEMAAKKEGMYDWVDWNGIDETAKRNRVGRPRKRPPAPSSERNVTKTMIIPKELMKLAEIRSLRYGSFSAYIRHLIELDCVDIVVNEHE